MATRARRAAFLSWFPRGLLILTAILAPVIDRQLVPSTEPVEAQAEAADHVQPVEPGDVALDGTLAPEAHSC